MPTRLVLKNFNDITLQLLEKRRPVWYNKTIDAPYPLFAGPTELFEVGFIDHNSFYFYVAPSPVGSCGD